MSKTKDRFGASDKLGARLRSLRRAAGLSQTELARVAGHGWDQALVSRLESGDYPNIPPCARGRPFAGVSSEV